MIFTCARVNCDRMFELRVLSSLFDFAALVVCFLNFYSDYTVFFAFLYLYIRLIASTFLLVAGIYEYFSFDHNLPFGMRRILKLILISLERKQLWLSLIVGIGFTYYFRSFCHYQNSFCTLLCSTFFFLVPCGLSLLVFLVLTTKLLYENFLTPFLLILYMNTLAKH